MKYKTLRKIDTKEYINIYAFSSFGFTSEIPQLLSINTNIETMRNSLPDTDFSNYEMIEVEVLNSGEIGADIRNKLTPLKNLLAILKNKNNIYNLDEIKYDKLMKKNIESCEISIDNLTDLL